MATPVLSSALPSRGPPAGGRRGDWARDASEMRRAGRANQRAADNPPVVLLKKPDQSGLDGARSDSTPKGGSSLDQT